VSVETEVIFNILITHRIFYFEGPTMADPSILECLREKGILASLMESPLYFTLDLPERLKLLQQFGGQASTNELRKHFIGWVKTGYFA
jgi:hypothetical protein